MAEQLSTERTSLARRIAADNPWVQLALGLGLTLLTFLLGGWKPTLAVLVFLLLTAVAALGVSLRKAHDQLAAQSPKRLPAEGDGAATSPSEAPEADAEQSHAGQLSEGPPSEESQSDPGDAGSAASEPTIDIADEPWRELADAALDRDVTRTAAAAERFVAAADTDKQRLTRRAWSLRMRSHAGDVEAIPELERLVADNPAAADPVLALAESLTALSEYERSVGILEQAAEDVRERSSYLLAEASRIIRGCGDKERARSLATEALARAENDAERAKAHQEMGWAWWEDDHRLRAFTAWENALRANPTNDTLRFALAYRYSESDLDELAMLHYEVLLARTPKHPSARNNLGVVLGDLNMRFRAADSYRTAVEQGESLAASNMAWLMINAGCGTEAEEWLAKGREVEDVHPNIDRAAGRLADFRDHEEETHAAVEARAQELRDLVSHGLVPTDLPTGRWAIGDDDDVELAALNDDDSIDRRDFGVRYHFSRGPAGLDVTCKSGQYATKERGMGVLRDGVLRFYLRSSSGETRVITGHPMPDPDPSSD